jgi:L-lysine 6-transaminase
MSLVNPNGYMPKYFVEGKNVKEELAKYMLVDGYDFVLDLGESISPFFVDIRDQKKFTDFFTCFASMPIGMNHPKLVNDDFINYLGKVALNKPSNSDIYTEEMATFVKTFHNTAVPDYFKYSFYVSGGALAVENALKAAFDWKVRKNMSNGVEGEKGHKIIHLKQAFHGRSGYTMSLTNTDPNKVKYFPKFDWPRVTNPTVTFPLNDENLAKVIKLEEQSISEIKKAFADNPNDIAGMILEPIQGEGGDNHFRNEYLKQLRQLCDDNEALLIFDEVQTGLGLTGTWWAHEQMEVIPDIMSFGKKMQVCGILATDRLDDVPENVFHTSSRINSTWGGNLVDMVRSTRYLEIMEEENMLANVNEMGKLLTGKLNELQAEYPEHISSIRGRGLFTAYDMATSELRDKFKGKCFDKGLLLLGCGEKAVRFRPPVNIGMQQIEEGFETMKQVMKEIL